MDDDRREDPAASPAAEAARLAQRVADVVRAIETVGGERHPELAALRAAAELLAGGIRTDREILDLWLAAPAVDPVLRADQLAAVRGRIARALDGSVRVLVSAASTLVDRIACVEEFTSEGSSCAGRPGAVDLARVLQAVERDRRLLHVLAT